MNFQKTLLVLGLAVGIGAGLNRGIKDFKDNSKSLELELSDEYYGEELLAKYSAEDLAAIFAEHRIRMYLSDGSPEDNVEKLYSSIEERIQEFEEKVRRGDKDFVSDIADQQNVLKYLKSIQGDESTVGGIKSKLPKEPLAKFHSHTNKPS